MKFYSFKMLAVPIIILLVWSCGSKPKVIKSETQINESQTQAPQIKPESIFDTNEPVKSQHEVVVKEVLDTDKYSYLKVNEAENEFWVAITKREITIGDTYFYKGGLLKKNFYSKEYDRVFETVYLVSNIWKTPDAKEDWTKDKSEIKIKGGESTDITIEKIELAEGSISMSELLKNKEKYRDQLVKVTGKCFKVNPMIMKRNWIHLSDGSEKDISLVITTSENIPLGATVSLEGKISIDRDFGAGYRYDIIMEGAVLK